MTIIEIKNKDVLFSLLHWTYHTTLKALIIWIVNEVTKIVITEGHREELHKGDVHATIPARAIDIRSWIYAKPELLQDKINKNWVYDATRPHMKCAVLHARCLKCGENNLPPVHDKCSKCGEDIKYNWHFHLQVHPNTKFVGDNE